jgi:hypothetical protein
MPTISVICSRDITEDQSSYSNSSIACHTLLGSYTSPYTPLRDTIPPIPVKRRPLPLGIVKEPRPKQNCDNGGRSGQGMRTRWTNMLYFLTHRVRLPSSRPPFSIRTAYGRPATLHSPLYHTHNVLPLFLPIQPFSGDVQAKKAAFHKPPNLPDFHQCIGGLVVKLAVAM